MSYTCLVFGSTASDLTLCPWFWFSGFTFSFMLLNLFRFFCLLCCSCCFLFLLSPQRKYKQRHKIYTYVIYKNCDFIWCCANISYDAFLAFIVNISTLYPKYSRRFIFLSIIIDKSSSERDIKTFCWFEFLWYWGQNHK